jgi:hypothetical protein
MGNWELTKRRFARAASFKNLEAVKQFLRFTIHP